jgi:hypothetical protein
MLSLSLIHYHPERDQALLEEHAELHSGRKFVVSTQYDHGSNVLLQKAPKPLEETLVTARSLGFGYVMFSPGGSKMEHLFSAFPEEWEDQGEEPKEYRIIGEVSLEAEGPEEAAREFVDKVQGGEIVATVRNINTDSISDIYLGDLDGGGDELDEDSGGSPTGSSNSGDDSDTNEV